MKKSEKKKKTVDVGLVVAKIIAFLCCLLLGVLPSQYGFSLSADGWGIDFLTIFISIFFGLILYFSLGVFILRLVIPGYSKRINLGDSGHASEVFIITIISNVILHVATLYYYGVYAWNVLLIVISAVFFTYPIYYLVNALWNMQREVRHINSGKNQVNTRFYANTQLPDADMKNCLPVTISIPVYTENNAIIFETISSCLEAIGQFKKKTGEEANLLISDDGLARILGGIVTDELLIDPPEQVAERIAFYREHEIAFVARPFAGRKGKFKKGSNLNYSYDLAKRLKTGDTLETLFSDGGDFAGGYAEGEIIVNDLILMLDKDSGIVPGILEATSPEFFADPLLAYTQHATGSANEGMNYFTRIMSRLNDVLFKISLPNKALQGIHVPLMGHNAFIRREFLEKSGGWPEDRVSEDFAKAIDAYKMGYHGKFIAYPDLDFTEHVCQHFVEETEKQSRYSYGISEFAFGGASSSEKKRDPEIKFGRVEFAHAADIVIYYFSYFNLGAAIPTMLLLLYTHQIYYFAAGILINFIIFWLCPSIHAMTLGKTIGFKKRPAGFLYYALIGFTFFGHGYSMVRGFFVYLGDRISKRYDPFGATSIDIVERSFIVGLKILGSYYKKNLPGLAASIFIFYGCLMVLGDIPWHIIRPLIVAFLMIYVFAPVFLMPQLFALPKKK